MIPKKSLTILLLLLLWSTISRSQIDENKIDLQLKSCLTQLSEPTTTNMCNCTYDAINQWDVQMNAVYNELMNKLKSQAKNKLKTAQKQWVAFKEKEVALIDATYGAADGATWQVVRAEKMMNLIRDRVLSLQLMLESASNF